MLLFYKHNYTNKLIHEFANKTTNFEQMGHYLQLFDTDGMLARSICQLGSDKNKLDKR